MRSFYKALTRERAASTNSLATPSSDFVSLQAPPDNNAPWELELQLGESVVLRMRGV